MYERPSADYTGLVNFAPGHPWGEKQIVSGINILVGRNGISSEKFKGWVWENPTKKTVALVHMFPQDYGWAIHFVIDPAIQEIEAVVRVWSNQK